MASFVPPPPAAPPPAFIPSVRQMQVRQLIDAVRQVESGNREGAKSRKGALGPMQVMPETLKNPGYGLKPATDYSEQGLDRFGQEYLQAMIQHYGDVRDALVAYNWGPGNANRWISRGRKDAALPAETRNYLNRVGLDYSRRMKNRDASILEAEEMLSASASPMQERPAPVAAAQEPEAAPAPAPEQEPDWISPAMGGSFPVSERKRSDPEGAISLLAQAQRFLNPGPRPGAFADGGAVRVPEGEAEEVSAGVGSLSDRARSMFAVSPLDYRPAARGARAAAERVGEELSEPGRVPAADTRQRLVRMAQDALEAGKVAGEIGYELLVPQDLTDVGLMVAMGPGGRLAKAGIGAALMAMDPDEAEAGKIDALRAAAARIRQSPLPAKERATRAFSRKPPVVDPNEVDPYPGVFGMSPAQKAAEASTRIEQESPWLKTLFGVNRADLYEMSKRKGDRPGEIAEPPNPRGSELAARVMTPRNAQRLQDELAEAQKYPELFRPMHAWYTMDPAYQRLLQIMPKDEADTAYARLNSFVATASPMSEPLTEIPRGLAANMMENAGLFDIFRRVGGKNAGQRAEALRGEGVPDEEIKRVLGLVPALERFPGHSAHSTHSEMMGKLRQNEYKVISDAPKVRVYSQASGVPGHPYGFQTDSPIVDAGITRNIGFARVSGSQTPGDSLAAAPYRDIRPWWAQQVAGPLGLEAVPAQAINWATSSPATGVGTSLGATKLELLARYIGQRSMELGVDPFVLRDLVLSGKAFADGGEVTVRQGIGTLAPRAAAMTRGRAA